MSTAVVEETDDALKAAAEAAADAQFQAMVKDVGGDSADPAVVQAIMEKGLEDSPLAVALSAHMKWYLCWTRDRGWMRWTGKVWGSIPDPHASEYVRRALVAYWAECIRLWPNANQDRRNSLGKLLSKKKAVDVTYFLKGLLVVAPEKFDSDPYLLNCPNGVVDLRTGDIGDHNPKLRMTKIAKVPYWPNATHADWTQALAAIPEDVQEWLQVRYGQGITGFPTDDDVLPIQQGGGQNGKSTLVSAVVSAAGDYGVYVPEKVLLANPNEHPTDMMTLRGARLAVIEETPEGKHLPTKRLKDLLGTPTMTARAMRQDFVSWDTSHSLFLNTNHLPQVAETDHATWRRLALVKFPFKFVDPSQPLMSPEERHGDPGLRDRLKYNSDDQLEAVLAWVIKGAIAWFEMDRRQLPTPLSVQSDTQDWRAETDLVMAYAQERLSFGGASSIVLATELFDDFKEWLSASGRQEWSETLFSSRFQDHELAKKNYVERKRIRSASATIQRRHPPIANVKPLAQQVTVWVGVAFNL